jgi:hypothetical protein
MGRRQGERGGGGVVYTSYFANLRHLDASKCVSIALYTPRWARKIQRYPTLAPSERVFQGYKCGNLSWEDYKTIYIGQLYFLDPRTVALDLGDDAILLCYEKPGEHCHRRLVADWLEMELGIQVPEWTEAGDADSHV